MTEVRGLGLLGRRGVTDEERGRLAPGQHLVRDFPILHAGSIPYRRDPSRLGLPDLGRGRDAAAVDDGRAARAGRRAADLRHPLRHHLDQARHGLGGRRRGAPAAQPGPPGCATHVVAHSEEGYTANIPLETALRDDVLLAYRSTGPSWRRSTADRSACSCPASTSGRAPSGSAASRCSTTTSRDSGSASATPTRPIRGRRSATASESPPPLDDFDQVQRVTAPGGAQRGRVPAGLDRPARDAARSPRASARWPACRSPRSSPPRWSS